MTEDSNRSSDEVDDQLKQALAAAFGDDAIDLLDDALDGNEGSFGETDWDAPGQPSPSETRIEWMQRLTQAIYADRIESDEVIRTKHQEPRHLLFQIGTHLFAVPLTSVQHVERDPKITALPRTPSWLRGVASFRGEILSVTDLRNLLEIEGERPNEGERIVIVQDPGSELTTGLIVDQVLGIRTSGRRDPNEIPEPQFPAVADARAEFDGQMTCLVNVQKLFQSEQLASFSPLS